LRGAPGPTLGYMTPIEEDTVQPTQNWSAANGRIRTSDQEREKIAEILRAAMAEGRLTLEEGEERLAAVYAAKYRDELAPLTADLPGNGRPALAETPEARTATRRAVRRHFGGVAVVAAVLVGLFLLSGAHFFWPIFPLMFLLFAVGGRRRRAYYYRHYHHQGYGQPVAPWNSPDYR
jgi:hypothetical protein